ncbi:hypothetical protein TeGR_g132, partial [Tetraparma gracilis]
MRAASLALGDVLPKLRAFSVGGAGLPFYGCLYVVTSIVFSVATQVAPELTRPPAPNPPPAALPPAAALPIPTACLKMGVRGVMASMVLLDFVGTIFSMLGLQLCGSGLHTVVMSGAVCWSAVLSFFMLKKKVSAAEFGSLVIIVTGLVFSALAQTEGSPSTDVAAAVAVAQKAPDLAQFLAPRNSTGGAPPDPVAAAELHAEEEYHPPSFIAGAKAMNKVWLGMIVTMIASWVFALNYICAEVIQRFKNAPSSKFLCEKIGLFDLLLCLFCMLVHTVPNWQKLVSAPVKAAEGNPLTILLCMALAIASTAGHMIAYFWIVKNSGAVTVGVMKSMQAVATFGISSALFCSQQSSQCFTLERGIATMLVSVGVAIYSWTKNQGDGKGAGGAGG